VTAADRLPGRLGADLLEAARAAFTHGLNNAALAAAIIMVLAAGLSTAFFRGLHVESTPTAAEQAQTEPGRELVAR